MSEKVAIIFGGSGSVGMAFVEHLLTAPSSDTAYSVIILADLRPPTPCHYQTHLKAGLSTGKVTYVSVDVRDIQTFKTLPARCDLIANFAAVHREPGHASHEYFETNLKGAESVTAYATQAHCTKLLFTSSISPYGPADQAKTEASLPCPNTPYGISKLIAEKIHLIWASAKSERLLIIVRPGVLFGPGEGGNVGRMIQAIQRGLFFYSNNQHIVKSGGYIKELCCTMTWMLQHAEHNNERTILYNFSLNPPPCFQDMAQAIQHTLNDSSKIRNIPFHFIYFASKILHLLFSAVGMRTAFNPVRIKKLKSANHILPKKLETLGYTYRYTLQEALADWKACAPEDWKPKSLQHIEKESNFIHEASATNTKS